MFWLYCNLHNWLRDEIHPVTLAVAWAGTHPAVTSPIIGARNLEQLEPSLMAADLELDTAFYKQISALSRTPAPATDRLEEQLPED